MGIYRLHGRLRVRQPSLVQIPHPSQRLSWGTATRFSLSRTPPSQPLTDVIILQSVPPLLLIPPSLPPPSPPPLPSGSVPLLPLHSLISKCCSFGEVLPAGVACDVGESDGGGKRQKGSGEQRVGNLKTTRSRRAGGTRPKRPKMPGATFTPDHPTHVFLLHWQTDVGRTRESHTWQPEARSCALVTSTNDELQALQGI